MSEFDPYLKWLGIRATTRPVNHYRLLGVELFESDKDVISMAADRQMTHIRTYQSGPNGKASQKILDELARARRCLLVEEKKIAYDRALRARLGDAGAATAPTIAHPPAIAETQAVAPPVIQPVIVDSDAGVGDARNASSTGLQLDVRSDPDARKKTKSREKKQLLLSLVGWVSGGLAALGVGAFLLTTGILTPSAKDDIKGGKGENRKLIAKNTVDEESTDSDSGNSSAEKKSVKRKPGKKRNAKPAPASGPPDFETPVVWTLKDTDKYPAPANAERALLSRVTSQVSQKRVGKLESSAPSTAGTNGVEQKINGLKRPGEIMIGVSYILDSDHKIKNLQPVFRTKASISSNDMKNASSLLAKPGYAVGEIEASELSPLNCVRLRFMKIRHDRLDPEDSYFSSWIGREIGPVKTIENPLNAPIVGTYADINNDAIQTLGLIASHDSMSSSEIVLEIASASPKTGTNRHAKNGNLEVATSRTEPSKNPAIIDGRAPDLPGRNRLPDVEGLEKQSIPPSSVRNVARKQVKKIYGDMISNDATRPRINRKNAESIIKEARVSGDDLAMQFAMLDAAKEISVGKGDCKTAMMALRELDRRFDDYDFWDEAVGVVQDAGKNLGRSGDRSMAQELETIVRDLIDEAIMSGESRSAGKLVSFGMKAASRNGDAQALRFYKAKDKESDEVAKLKKQYTSALVKLAADPENSNANEQKGRYLIVVQGDYNAAIECWSLSDDDELLAIVKDESSLSASASFLARRWQNLGKDHNTAFGRRCFERAITILQSAGKSRQADELQKLLDQ